MYYHSYFLQLKTSILVVGNGKSIVAQQDPYNTKKNTQFTYVEFEQRQIFETKRDITFRSIRISLNYVLNNPYNKEKVLEMIYDDDE